MVAITVSRITCAGPGKTIPNEREETRHQWRRAETMPKPNAMMRNSKKPLGNHMILQDAPILLHAVVSRGYERIREKRKCSRVNDVGHRGE